jgi:hypothetical protein
VNWNWKYPIPIGDVGEGRAMRGRRGGIGRGCLKMREAVKLKKVVWMKLGAFR